MVQSLPSAIPARGSTRSLFRHVHRQTSCSSNTTSTWPMFQKANRVSIYNGSFLNVSSGRDASIDLLVQKSALGALHNAAERFDPPKCHPETRIALLDNVDAWARDPNRKPVMWLSGPAGAGKSAIAQTLAERWEEQGMLGGTFFFFRTAPGRNVKTALVATISYQLVSSVAEIRPHIAKAIESDVGIFGKNLKTQMDRLVIRPLKAVSETIQHPIIIVIDGLDECSGEDSQDEILKTVSFACEHNLPVSFLIASRPERQLRESFADDSLARVTSRIVLDHTHDPDKDIQLFLRCKFAEIRRKNHFVDDSWPSDDIITTLIEKSSGQFIYASTVVKYVASPRKDPRRSLEVVMGIKPPSRSTDRPFEELDALYIFILDSVLEESFEYVQAIIMVLLFPYSALRLLDDTANHSPAFFDDTLLLDAGQVYYHLADMHSLLEVPPFKNRGSIPIRIIHASLSDFLADPSRAASRYIKPVEAETAIAKMYLKLMLVALSQKPRTNAKPPTLVKALVYYLPLAEPCDDLQHGLEALLAEDDQRYTSYIKSIDFVDEALPRRDWIPPPLTSMRWYLERCRAVRLSKTFPSKFEQMAQDLVAGGDASLHRRQDDSAGRSELLYNEPVIAGADVSTDNSTTSDVSNVPPPSSANVSEVGGKREEAGSRQALKSRTQAIGGDFSTIRRRKFSDRISRVFSIRKTE